MNRTHEGFPTLDELVESSPFEVGPGIGLNEIIVAAGYHPVEYDRNAFRAFGGQFPRYSSQEWEELVAPFKMLQANSILNIKNRASN